MLLALIEVWIAQHLLARPPSEPTPPELLPSQFDPVSECCVVLFLSF